jgi:hypothetical protein
MTTHIDWLPRNHTVLYNQANQTAKYLTDEVLERIGFIGNILTWYNTDFIPKHNLFNSAFLAWNNPAERTPAKTATLISAENEFKPSYRELYNGYLKRNPLVTDTDLVEMGLPKRSSGGKTPPQPPSSLVEATVDTSIPATIVIHYRDKGSKSIAKPKGMHGVEIIHAVLDSPPTDWSQLTNSDFSTRTPVKLAFRGEQRGKILYFAIRWENNTGDKGPWNDIQDTIIP